jgi:hypothetical protein
MTQYKVVTPWQNETWITGSQFSPYARLAGRPLSNGTFLTDIGRGVTLLVNGTTVTENRTPSQDDLADADAYYLGGHEYVVDQSAADILINAGYGEYVTPIAGS